MHTIEISDDVYEAARRTAALDSIDVNTLIEGLVRRHVEYIDLFRESSADLPPFSLERYEMDRTPGEAEEDYQDRLRMFTSLCPPTRDPGMAARQRADFGGSPWHMSSASRFGAGSLAGPEQAC